MLGLRLVQVLGTHLRGSTSLHWCPRCFSCLLLGLGPSKLGFLEVDDEMEFGLQDQHVCKEEERSIGQRENSNRTAGLHKPQPARQGIQKPILLIGVFLHLAEMARSL